MMVFFGTTSAAFLKSFLLFEYVQQEKTLKEKGDTTDETRSFTKLRRETRNVPCARRISDFLLSIQMFGIRYENHQFS